SAAGQGAAADRPPEARACRLEDGTEFWLTVQPTRDIKCVRCWQRRADVGAATDHPELCGRCVSNVEGPGEQRRWA
ncbi:MAG: hypothetical protein JJT93_15905, partial [Gammaproteobacteria bacterium]|nr:hypothetical protein [Gammaproteobacteria bacterium]